jgi:hypothetical protein
VAGRKSAETLIADLQNLARRDLAGREAIANVARVHHAQYAEDGNPQQHLPLFLFCAKRIK